ncbi:putative holin-like toxin [Lentibacillus persicus]
MTTFQVLSLMISFGTMVAILAYPSKK